MKEDLNLYWHAPSVTVQQRWKLNGNKSCVLWFTGLSASGKSTLANAVSKQLHLDGIKSYVLDGDNIRHGLNKDLDFSPEARKENIRRVGEVAKLFIDAGLIVMAAFISPFREDRRNARRLFRDEDFIEIFLKCSLAECEKRDPKGIYKKARAGQLKEFTGISSPYEEPDNPELIIETASTDIAGSVRVILNHLLDKQIIYAGDAVEMKPLSAE
jgi:adenylylsulfate kinase